MLVLGDRVGRLGLRSPCALFYSCAVDFSRRRSRRGGHPRGSTVGAVAQTRRWRRKGEGMKGRRRQQQEDDFCSKSSSTLSKHYECSCVDVTWLPQDTSTTRIDKENAPAYPACSLAEGRGGRHRGLPAVLSLSWGIEMAFGFSVYVTPVESCSSAEAASVRLGWWLSRWRVPPRVACINKLLERICMYLLRLRQGATPRYGEPPPQNHRLTP